MKKTKSCNYTVTVDKDCIKRAGGSEKDCAVKPGELERFVGLVRLMPLMNRIF